eukprot:2361554-Prymnesium_polylepis.1
MTMCHLDTCVHARCATVPDPNSPRSFQAPTALRPESSPWLFTWLPLSRKGCLSMSHNPFRSLPRAPLIVFNLQLALS